MFLSTYLRMDWYELSEIPSPQFDASEFAIECFRKEVFYLENQHS